MYFGGDLFCKSHEGERRDWPVSDEMEAGGWLYPVGSEDRIPGGIPVLHDRTGRHECPETGEFLRLVHHGGLRGGKSCGQCGDPGHRLYWNGTFGIYWAEHCEESV